MSDSCLTLLSHFMCFIIWCVLYLTQVKKIKLKHFLMVRLTIRCSLKCRKYGILNSTQWYNYTFGDSDRTKLYNIFLLQETSIFCVFSEKNKVMWPVGLRKLQAGDSTGPCCSLANPLNCKALKGQGEAYLLQ